MRVRLLGEALVAFRDDQGRVGLVGEACSHAGASLTFAQNEGDGIRCVLHDWKFDATGRCIDLPGLVPGSALQGQAHIKGYRCAEQGGLVFAYLGPRQDDLPPLPSPAWIELPEPHVQHDRYQLPQSWARTLADALHPAHAAELHVSPDRTVPRFTMPLNLELPAPANQVRCVQRLVPIDDTHTLIWRLSWDPGRPLVETEKPAAQPLGDPDPFAFPEGSTSPLLRAYQALVEAARTFREEGTAPPGVDSGATW